MQRSRSKAAALLAGCLLVAAVEALLALFGVAPLAREDRFVGFEGSAPLFVPSGEPGRYEVNPAKHRFFSAQSLREPKPPGTFRIVSFGGSTTFGHPYGNATSFPAWTARALGALDRGHAYESVNAGGISYASYRVRRLMEEMARFSPDLYVVYSGHNEFLERRTYAGILAEGRGLRRVRAALHRLRIYTALYRMLVREPSADGRRTVLPDEVVTTLEQLGGPAFYHRDDEFRAGVTAHYRHEIEAMVRLARARAIPLVLCTLPSNLSGVSPFKSEHRAGLDARQLEAWDAAFAAAEERLTAGDAAAALVRLAEAEAIDDRYALLHFRKGVALSSLGRAAEAFASFVRAKEEDVIPLRALEDFNRIVREAAARDSVPLADVEALFRRLSPDGIPGPALFVDHVHPTLEAQQQVALLVAETAVRAGLVPVAQDAWRSGQEQVRAALARDLAAFDARYWAMGYWVAGGTFLWAGKADEAERALLRAWQQIKDFAPIPLALAKIELGRGNWDPALEYVLAARRLQPAEPQAAEVLVWGLLGAGRPAEALAELDAGGPVRGKPAFHVLRAVALLRLGRADEARAEVRLAEADAARLPVLRDPIAALLWELGEPEEARAQARRLARETGQPEPERWLAAWEAKMAAGGGQ